MSESSPTKPRKFGTLSLEAESILHGRIRLETGTNITEVEVSYVVDEEIIEEADDLYTVRIPTKATLTLTLSLVKDPATGIFFEVRTIDTDD